MKLCTGMHHVASMLKFPHVHITLVDTGLLNLGN